MKKNYFKSLMQVALLLAAPFVVSSCDDVIGQEDNPVASYVQWKTDADVDEVEMKVVQSAAGFLGKQMEE